MRLKVPANDRLKREHGHDAFVPVPLNCTSCGFWRPLPGPASSPAPSDLRAAGFESVEIETVGLSSLVTARDAACGIVLGSPFRAEIERLGASALERATTAVEQALRS